ncbi:MAG: exodeoxyribonuclease V subunit gamma [Candidatus Obscuribacterales bacterium]|nr:exodeoxyribonuclease V subunit gamma [Candidatus Obscuribacterales bacterium]
MTNAKTLAQVELIVGPYRSGKTELVLKELVEFSRTKPLMNSLIMVPSARYRSLLSQRIKEQLAQFAANSEKVSGIFGLNILPFYQVCQMVLSLSGEVTHLIPDKLRARVISLVVDDLVAQKKLPILEPIAGFVGTSPALLELVDAFERAGISSADVKGRLSKAPPSPYHNELSLVYDGYWKKLDQLGLLDQRRLAFQACEVLQSKKISGLNLDWLICDGFDRISGLQAKVIEGLSAHATKTCLLFDFEPEQESQLKQYQWKERGYIDLVNVLKPKMRSTSAIQGVKRTEEVFSGLDRFVEIQEIARRAKQLIVDGRRPSDILVTARQIGPYKAAVIAAFRNFGIPYFMDESIALVELPLIQFLMRLMKLASSDFKRFDVVACLRSPFFAGDRIGISKELVSEIDSITLTKQLVSGKERWLKAFADKPEYAQKVQGLFDAVMPPVEKRSITEHCIWLENLIDHLLVITKEDDLAQQLFKGYDRRAMLEVRNTIALLIQEERIFDLPKVSYETFIKSFEKLIEDSNFRSQPEHPDCVTICSAELAPNKSFEAVFIAGLVEGQFPQRSGASGFAGGDELAAWAKLGIEIDNPRSHPTYEWALFRAQIDRAKSFVSLSYPHYELSGQECVPSFFLQSVEKKAKVFVAPYQNSLTNPASAVDAINGWHWRHEGLESDFASVPAINKLETNLSGRIGLSQMRILGGNESLYNGWLVDPVKAGVLKIDMPEHFSASRLNDYGRCPFRYWVSHVLNLEPRIEPEAGLSPKLLGNLHHYILETFFKKLATNKIDFYLAPKENIAELLDEAIKSGWSWIERREEFLPGKFWKYEQEDIAFRLRRLIARERERGIADKDQFAPYMFEASFGRDNSPMLELSGKDKVSIRGQVDRIDVTGASGAQKVRLIDYKTSSQAISKADASQGRNMQLPLYALAVERAIMPGSHVSKAMYVSINSGEVVGTLDFDEPGTDEDSNLLQLTEEYVQTYVKNMRSGDFRVMPNGEHVCKSCIHKKSCRISELMEVEAADESD